MKWTEQQQTLFNILDSVLIQLVKDGVLTYTDRENIDMQITNKIIEYSEDEDEK